MNRQRDLSIDLWFCLACTLELRHAQDELQSLWSAAKEHGEKTAEAWEIVRDLASGTTTEVNNIIDKDAADISDLLAKPHQDYLSNVALAKALLIEYEQETAQ